MVQQFKITSRTLLLIAGIAVVVVGVGPAWNHLNGYNALQPIRNALRDGDVEQAHALLAELEDMDVKPAEVAYLLGVTNRRLGRLKPAFEYLQRAESLGWPVDDITRQRYMTRFQNGDIDGTREYLQGILLRGTNDVVAEEIYESLAKGFLTEFRIGDATVVLDHWLSWKPNAYQPLLWRAQLYDQDGDWAESAKSYQKILDSRPDDLSARLHLADALIEDHHVVEAKAQYAEALRRFPDDLIARFGLAACERREGNSEAAINWLEQMLAADPSPRLATEVCVELGQIAMESSEHKMAAQHFTRALELFPNSALAHHSLGRAYGILGETEKSLKHFKLSEELNDQQRRMDDAVARAREYPGDVKSRFEVAQLLLEQENEDEAVNWLMTVLHLDPDHAQARAALNKIFESQRTAEVSSSAKQSPNTQQ